MTAKETSFFPVAAALLASIQSPAAEPTHFVSDLIAKIKTPDDTVRGPAWKGAAEYGSGAVQPLIATMSDPDYETARCARRALWKVVRAAGAPGNTKEAAAVEQLLLAQLPETPPDARREILWMLSEVGTDHAVAPIAAQLNDQVLREDARCVLTRLPGAKAVAALKKALSSAPEEFKYALAESLRARGEKVNGYPSKKLIPTKKTAVTYVKPVPAS